MINNVTVKGIISYKTILRKNKRDREYIEFGLAFNSVTATPKVYKIVCQALDKQARFVSNYLSPGDIIIINAFMTTKIFDCKEIPILNMNTFELVKTNKNLTLTDKSIDESLFAKHIKGFDE
jgi:hypothetical protein